MDMDKFSVYNDIRAKLLAGGIPAELILDVCHGCFIYGAGDCFSISWVTGGADLFCAVLAEWAGNACCGMAGQPARDSAGNRNAPSRPTAPPCCAPAEVDSGSAPNCAADDAHGNRYPPKNSLSKSVRRIPVSSVFRPASGTCAPLPSAYRRMRPESPTFCRFVSSSAPLFAPERTKSPKSKAASPGMTVSRSNTHRP